ncbi:MAG: AraC family ligand binding domain-containing protein [Clostridiales bacterium]|nr:AraC family ligand binding domain-containing protein [Clostridiales bacterium]
MQTIGKEIQEDTLISENSTDTGNDAIYIERQIREPGFVMPYEHAHNYCEIFYLKSGSCNYYINSHTYHLEAGNLFLIKPGDLHSTSYEGSVPCERFAVSCTPQSLPPLLSGSAWRTRGALYNLLQSPSSRQRKTTDRRASRPHVRRKQSH